MKDFQAYKFIRVEKDNAKKAGARAKRAEEAANKDKWEKWVDNIFLYNLKKKKKMYFLKIFILFLLIIC